MEKIAIIGLSCLFPDAQTPAQFWENLLVGKDSTSLATELQMGVNPDRFYDATQGKTVEPGKYYCKRGGYIKDFQFDPTGYRLSPELLINLDQIYQWSLSVAKQALQDSGYLGNVANCGVILGSPTIPTKRSHQSFMPLYQKAIDTAVQELLEQPQFRLQSMSQQQALTAAKLDKLNSLTAGFPAALVAQALGLSGIHFTFDAACSSALYAIQLASTYLLAGKTDLMLAGAAIAGDPWIVHTAFSLFQAYPAPGNESCPLDASSDGLLTGEGVGMVALKRYQEAVRDGDRIYATILGTGLSNDGKGKHFFSPSSKGQILALERAYAAAEIDPRSIDYVECHATGTALGDRTELSSMESFFGSRNAHPLMGSVKANVGHLLTAAGMPSLFKVILSLNQGLIPPTIRINQPLSSEQGGVAADRVVREATPWPTESREKPRRAAVSAFGFGGTNTHLVLEQGSVIDENVTSSAVPPLLVEKLAIVGIDAHFGNCKGLDAFERCIHRGEQPLVPVPSQRWQGIESQPQLLQQFGLDGSAPEGAYIADFEMDYLQFKIPPDATDQPSPQQLLMLKVADNALRDAGVQKGGNVAVIVAMTTELSMHQWRGRSDLSWQVREGLRNAGIILPEAAITELEGLVCDSLQAPVKVSLGLSYISSNLAASRIEAHWDFSGPAFTLSAEENAVFKALEVAQLLLTDPTLEAVVVGAVDLAGGIEPILLRHQTAPVNTGVPTLSYDQQANGWMAGEGAGAIVLKRLGLARQDQDRIYAVIDAVSLVNQHDHPMPDSTFPSAPDAALVQRACQQAFAQAGINPEDVGYLELYAGGIAAEDAAEIAGLTPIYRNAASESSCAIGSVKANLGHAYAASGMASLIKIALCLYRQYIPPVPQWSGPKQLELWQNSSFYVPAESRVWFAPDTTARRVAALNGLGLDRTYAHIILAEEPSQKNYDPQYLQQTPFYLFPLAALDATGLLMQLTALEQLLEEQPDLAIAASQVFTTFQQQSQSPYALVIVGHDSAELLQEIQRARQGIPNAFAKGSDWKTPLGSYCTANPLGRKGGVAFVYPGAFTSYPGVGREMNRLFPKVSNALEIFSASDRLRQLMKVLNQRIFPRSLTPLSRRAMERLDAELLEDAPTMLLMGTMIAVGYTLILRDYFRVRPQSVFGYSLGEFSMMYALQVWTSADELSGNLNTSPLFKTRLSGPKQTVRDHWGLPRDTDPEEEFWGNYVLMTTPDRVRASLKQEPHVYLTHINTPTEVVIAGAIQGCQRVIQQLRCDYFPVPSQHVLHCEPMQSEFDELVKWFTLPIQEVPETQFYSAADYHSTTLEQGQIAHHIAKTLCQPLDFPRLIRQVYEGGAKLFIELGPGGTCTRWIRETLKQQEHTAIAINQRGVDEHTSILRALAQLVSHRVDLDLSSLYLKAETPRKSLLQTVTLGGKRIYDSILATPNPQQFKVQPQPIRDCQPASASAETLTIPSPSEPLATPIPPKIASQSVLKPQLTSISPHSTPDIPYPDTPAIPIPQSQTFFLNMRQETLRDMGQLLQLQVAIAQKMLAIPIGQPPQGKNLNPREPMYRRNSASTDHHPPSPPIASLPKPVIWDEAQLLEFATGKIAPIFGPDYAPIDAYPYRVRLPMPPYLFVSRVTQFEAKRGCFEPCFLESEYDVPADAWYAVDDQVPASIIAESSQSNILLISYLGADFDIKRERFFRALDGVVTYVDAPPKTGETFRCQVRINSFIRNRTTFLYFFSADYFVGDRKFLELKAGAGFFTKQELAQIQGITPTKRELEARAQTQKRHFDPPLRCDKPQFDPQDILQLSAGNLAACFGEHYAQEGRNSSLRLPTPPFLMIDRVTSIDPQGGIWGLGLVTAEKSLDPQQWYFNCHFKDDFCLPGTLISEGATQLLNFYLLYLGLQSKTLDACFYPMPHTSQSSRSRGQVTSTSHPLTYQLEVFDIGLEPHPFVKGEISVIFEGKTISIFQNFAVQLFERRIES
jgi:PfaB family protein